MVWAGVSAEQKTLLRVVRGRLNDVAFRDAILDPLAVPFFAQHGLWLFQQNSVRPELLLNIYASNTSMSCRGRL